MNIILNSDFFHIKLGSRRERRNYPPKKGSVLQDDFGLLCQVHDWESSPDISSQAQQSESGVKETEIRTETHGITRTQIWGCDDVFSPTIIPHTSSDLFVDPLHKPMHLHKSDVLCQIKMSLGNFGVYFRAALETTMNYRCYAGFHFLGAFYFI